MCGDGTAMVVSDTNGQMILIDPVGVAFAVAIAKENCKASMYLNRDRVHHFIDRMSILGKTAVDTVIVLVNADDCNGKILAEKLMPDYNWQQFRDHNQIPFARGLANRDGILSFLEIIDSQAADKLKDMTDISVVIVDHGVAEVFPAHNA